MDSRRPGRDNRVSSYASLASRNTPSTSNDRDRDRDRDRHRNHDDRPPSPRGGGRGYAGGRGSGNAAGFGGGRGRGRYDGRGRGSFRDLPTSTSTLTTNPVHAQRFEPSPMASRRPIDHPSPSPDRSGYESGEIMPQQPIVQPRRSSVNSTDNRVHAETSWGGGSMDGRGSRFSGRGRGPSGRFLEVGGRGRSGGRGGDSYSSGRPGEPRANQPPRDIEIARNEPITTDRSLQDRPRIMNSINSRNVQPELDRGGPSRVIDDRLGKRPREVMGYQADYEEKRSRIRDNGPRIRLDEDIAFKAPPIESRPHPVEEFRRFEHERRPIDESRGHADGQRRDEAREGGPPIHADRPGPGSGSDRNDLVLVGTASGQNRLGPDRRPGRHNESYHIGPDTEPGRYNESKRMGLDNRPIRYNDVNRMEPDNASGRVQDFDRIGPDARSVRLNDYARTGQDTRPGRFNDSERLGPESRPARYNESDRKEPGGRQVIYSDSDRVGQETRQGRFYETNRTGPDGRPGGYKESDRLAPDGRPGGHRESDRLGPDGIPGRYSESNQMGPDGRQARNFGPDRVGQDTRPGRQNEWGQMGADDRPGRYVESHHMGSDIRPGRHCETDRKGADGAAGRYIESDCLGSDSRPGRHTESDRPGSVGRPVRYVASDRMGPGRSSEPDHVGPDTRSGRYIEPSRIGPHTRPVRYTEPEHMRPDTRPARYTGPEQIGPEGRPGRYSDRDRSGPDERPRRYSEAERLEPDDRQGRFNQSNRMVPDSRPGRQFESDFTGPDVGPSRYNDSKGLVSDTAPSLHDDHVRMGVDGGLTRYNDSTRMRPNGGLLRLNDSDRRGPDTRQGRYNDFDRTGPGRYHDSARVGIDSGPSCYNDSRGRIGGLDEPRITPPYNGPRMQQPHMDDTRGGVSSAVPVRDHEIQGRRPLRDEPRDGGFRDERSRNSPHDDTSSKPIYRDSHLTDETPVQRHLPSHPLDRRDRPRDGPRDFHGRDSLSDFPPEDLLRDVPTREIHSRDVPGRSDKDPRRQLHARFDPPSRPPPPSETERNRDLHGDNIRSGQLEPASEPTTASDRVAPPASQGLVTSSEPRRRDVDATSIEPGLSYREEPRPSDVSTSDTSGLLDNRGAFGDRGRGRGRGGRGPFPRGGGHVGRGRGRGEFGRFGLGGRGGSNQFYESDVPADAVNHRSNDENRKIRPDAMPSSGESRRQQDMKQEVDPASLHDPLQKELSNDTGSKVEDSCPPTSNPLEVKTEAEELTGPRPISPPPPGQPSGVVLALARLADLEVQMEYTYAKHIMLVRRQEELSLQTKILETLPIGLEAFQEDLDAFCSSTELEQ